MYASPKFPKRTLTAYQGRSRLVVKKTTRAQKKRKQESSSDSSSSSDSGGESDSEDDSPAQQDIKPTLATITKKGKKRKLKKENVGLPPMLLGNTFLYSSLKVNPVNLEGKTAIVTGSNVGIGLETARKLAGFGAHVVLACRDAAKAEVAKQDIVATTGNSNVEVMVVDFSSFASIRSFAREWNSKPIDILINNAGIVPAKFEIAEDGYEKMFTVDFLSHVLFTTLLLPSLTNNSRIINVSSAASYQVGKKLLDVNDLDSTKFLAQQGLKEGGLLDSHTTPLYGKAKLCQIIYSYVLRNKLKESRYASKNIFVGCCHPGLVTSSIWGRNSGISAEADKAQAKLQSFVNKMGISSEQGACNAVYLAVDPPIPASKGIYWDRQSSRTPNTMVFDKNLGEEHWKAWNKACGLSGI
ncbi:hypothetical protein MNV49_002429 [Pseudohyphozyma bogoriensis]|nr:hypothetical protein MNV49_002429 [Pseudohyphozyma bogoriensis]